MLIPGSTPASPARQLEKVRFASFLKAWLGALRWATDQHAPYHAVMAERCARTKKDTHAAQLQTCAKPVQIVLQVLGCCAGS